MNRPIIEELIELKEKEMYIKESIRMAENGASIEELTHFITPIKSYKDRPLMKDILNSLYFQGYIFSKNNNSLKLTKIKTTEEENDKIINLDNEYLEKNKDSIIERISNKVETIPLLEELKYTFDGLTREVTVRNLMNFLGNNYDIYGLYIRNLNYHESYVEELIQMADNNVPFYFFIDYYHKNRDGTFVRLNMANVLRVLFLQGYSLDGNSCDSRFRKIDPCSEFPEYFSDCILFLEKNKSELENMIRCKKSVFTIIEKLVFSKKGISVRVSIRELLDFLGDEYDLVYDSYWREVKIEQRIVM